MAKLSARGRTEVYRLAKQAEGSSTISKLALMSDRTVLTCSSFLEYSGKRRTGGWTVLGKLKKDVKPETWLANKLAAGWEQVTR